MVCLVLMENVIPLIKAVQLMACKDLNCSLQAPAGPSFSLFLGLQWHPGASPSLFQLPLSAPTPGDESVQSRVEALQVSSNGGGEVGHTHMWYSSRRWAVEGRCPHRWMGKQWGRGAMQKYDPRVWKYAGHMVQGPVASPGAVKGTCTQPEIGQPLKENENKRQIIFTTFNAKLEFLCGYIKITE